MLEQINKLSNYKQTNPGSFVPGSFVPGNFVPRKFRRWKFLPGDFVPGIFVAQTFHRMDTSSFGNRSLNTTRKVSASDIMGVGSLNKSRKVSASDIMGVGSLDKSRKDSVSDIMGGRILRQVQERLCNRQTSPGKTLRQTSGEQAPLIFMGRSVHLPRNTTNFVGTKFLRRKFWGRNFRIPNRRDMI